ncbi:MAG: wax ester/triacylglycerol synthase family O-acyltransferase [Acidimicrobiales bacterium]|nr:wax ester/triacylglycerol synthase family O-acyltransferase [Acidimicrobiales bacterium]
MRLRATEEGVIVQRLSGTDALFLSAETPAWLQSVGGLTILDPADSPDFSYDAVVANLRERIALVPKLRWKLRSVPLGLDRPVWVADRDFDLDNHLHRVTVPRPGGRRETAEVVGKILGHQIDRSRPLWELWYLDGIVNGRVAMVMKYHHCMLDGVAGSGMASLMLDLEQFPEEPPAPPPTVDDPSEPSELELLARGAFTASTSPLRAARYSAQLARRALSVANFARSNELPPFMAAPPSPINGPVGQRRAFSFASVSLADVKAVRRAFGVKANDVFLALCAGALRSHLLERGELPDKPLTTGVPVSTREEGDDSLDNRVAFMLVSLATDIADPAERIAAIHRSSTNAKAFTAAFRSTGLNSLGEVAPPLVVQSAIRLAAGSGLLDHMPSMSNTLISNVPGPPFTLWSVGAKVTGIFSTSVIMQDMGANITLFSYGDRVDFGIHVDPDVVADPWAIADALPVAMAELMTAAGLGAPTPVEDAFGAHQPRRARRRRSAD